MTDRVALAAFHDTRWGHCEDGECSLLADLLALADPEDIRLFHGHHPACGYTIEGDWSKCGCGAARTADPGGLRERLHEDIERAMTLSTDPVSRRERVHAAIDAALASETTAPAPHVPSLTDPLGLTLTITDVRDWLAEHYPDTDVLRTLERHIAEAPARAPTKIGVLAHETGDYTAYVAYFDDPARLQVAVDKLNASRLDTYSMEAAQAETRTEKLLSIPDVIDDDFLDLLAGYLSDAGQEIERADDVRERLEEAAREAAEEEEPEPVIPSPGQEEIGL